MTIGPHLAPPMPPRRSRAYRSRQVQQRRAIRLAIPAVLTELTVRTATLSARLGLIEARVTALLAQRLDVRDDQGVIS